MSKKDLRILVIKNRGMGDALMGLSTVQYIKELLPNSQVYFGVPSWVAPLFNNVETSSNSILSLQLKTPVDFFRYLLLLKKIKPQYIHELHAGGRTHLFNKMAAKILGIKYSYHNHELNISENEKTIHDQGKVKPLIQRDLDGAWTFLSQNKLIESNAPGDYKKNAPLIHIKATDKKQIVFGMVATRKTKMWPISHFSELSHLIKNKFPEYKIVIPLSHSELDKQIENQIAESNFADNCSIKKVALEDLPELLAGSLYYIGNDTGLKHLCIGLGVPTHTLFGPEPPFEWHPYDTQFHTYDYIDNLECRTVTHHYCGLYDCESMICLNQISSKNIFDKLFSNSED